MKNAASTVLMLLILLPSAYAQVNSAQSGPWGASSTWAGGTVPDSNTNVNIALGHLITIENASAACRNITFADTTSQLEMSAATASLKVYGDFTLAGVTHKAFKSWTNGAKIVFTGNALKQTLSGWNTTGSSTSFMEMVVDKDTGKVSTGRQNMRFSFGTTLEIKKGTFELDSTDDLESRTIGGTGTEGNIIVGPKGVFTMVGGSSHIRKGTFTDTVTSRTGKMTVSGKATFTSTSTNRVNFLGIDILEGGLVNLTTGGSAGYFNPALITVKSGGVFQSSTTTVVYHPSAYIVLEPGGEFNSATSTTPLPVNGINYSQGTVRFSRTIDQTLPAALTGFNNLYLSGGGVKSLSSNITINGTLSFRATASLNLGTFTLNYGPDAVLQYGAPGQTTPQTTSDVEFPAVNGPKNLSIYNTGGVTLHANRTITGNLTLSSGTFDNNGAADDKILTLGTGSTIRRASGTLSSAPAFAGTVNLSYISTLSPVVTSFEVPASNTAIQNLSIFSTQGVELGTNITVNGVLKFEDGSSMLKTGVYSCTLGNNAVVQGENSASYVFGKLSAPRTVGTSSSDFGGIGVSLGSGTDNLGAVTVSRISGPGGVLSVNGRAGIARHWIFAAGAQPSSGRELTLSWPSADDNGKVFNANLKVKVMRFSSNIWSPSGTPAAVHTADPRTVTVNTNVLSTFTVLDTLTTNSADENAKALPGEFHLRSNYPNPFNPSTTLAYDLGSPSFVRLYVVDLTGKTVAVLVNGYVAAGRHTAIFKADALASGIYFAVLKLNNSSVIRKMTLQK